MNDKSNILYVDDELNNLTGFKASFRRSYTIYTAQSAAEAMELLRSIEFKIIISDQRMPEMTGVEFFDSIKDTYPEPVRMLLTGYTDIESVIQAINEGNVYRYISKPWEEHELKMTIDNALDFYNAKNELRQRNQELEKAYDELEKFVYSASHDLRAPLASVLGIVQLAKMENTNADFGEYLNKIESSISKLDLFIQNIISYYRSEKLELKLTKIDLKKLICSAIESFEYFETAPEIDFQMEVEQNATILGDEARLKLIINNLLSNAIRYQKPDEKHKQVSIKAENKDNQTSISIKDNGVGISEKDLPKIFDMFYSTVSENSGSGIGLYIVKETIGRLSGSIKVESVPGEGSTFTVKIPE